MVRRIALRVGSLIFAVTCAPLPLSVRVLDDHFPVSRFRSSETKCLRNLGLISGPQARYGHGVAAVCPRFPEHPIDGRV